MDQLLAKYKKSFLQIPFVPLLLFVSLGLGVLSQFLFREAFRDSVTFWRIQGWLTDITDNRSPLPGLFFAILSGLVFVFCLYRLKLAGQGFKFEPVQSPPRPPRFGFWLTSLGLSALAAFAATHQSEEQPSGYLSLALRLLAIVLLVISVLIEENWRPPAFKTLLRWGRDNRTEILIVSLIIAAAFFLRISNLELYPYPIVNDEGEMGKSALCILSGKCSNFFEMAWAAQPYLASLPQALSLKLFGISTFAIRIPMAVVGALAVLSAYLFAREVFDRRVALIAAALMTTLPVLVHFSRVAVDNAVDVYFSSTLIWLLYRGAKHNDRLAYMAAGLLGGLTLYTYPGARLSLALGLGSVIYMCMRVKGYFRTHFLHFIIFAAVFLVTMLPITATYLQHPEAFNARLDREGIFTNGIVARQIQQPGWNLGIVLINQFARSSLVYVATPAEKGFYDGQRPYLISLAAIFFILGLTLVTAKIADPSYMTLFAWFWAAIIFGSTMTGSPPSTERMLNSMPALAIITAIGLAKSAEIFEKFGSLARWASPFLLIIILFYVSSQNYTFYFMEYGQMEVWGNTSDELTYESRTLIQPLGSQGRFYMIGEPLVFKDFGNFGFFSPDVERADFNTITRQALAALPNDKDALFIAIPLRQADLKQLASWLPGGTWNDVYRRYHPDQVLFSSYKISKEQLKDFTISERP